MALESKVPVGNMDEKWSKYKSTCKLVNPANKRNIDIKSEDGTFETQIAILIKNVDTLSEKVVIEWDDIATNKKIIGAFTKIMSDDQNKFTIKFSLDNGDEENFNTAKNLGADGFLTKPLDFIELKEKLINKAI